MTLYDELKEYCASDVYPFHMPGHKRRAAWLCDPRRIDLTEIDGFDNLHHAEGILRDAEMRAARLFKSSETHFLVNGSTAGILSAIGACTLPGKTLLMARNSHRSAFNAAALNRVTCAYLSPSDMAVPCDINGRISPEQVERALGRSEQVCAVFLTSPTYDGVVSDVAGIAEAAHRHGIPLIVASVGQGAVFYVACFVAFLNIGQWTYGVSILNGQPIRQGLQFKKLIKAPFVIAIIIGLILFFTQLPLPSIVSGCLSTVAGLNTPLAMFTVGIYLAQTDIKAMIQRKKLYAVSAVRLVLIPLIAVLLLTLLPEAWHDMKLALLVAVSCPVGSNVAVYAQLHGKDYGYAVETVVISTLFSIVSIPAIVYLANQIW